MRSQLLGGGGRSTFSRRSFVDPLGHRDQSPLSRSIQASSAASSSPMRPPSEAPSRSRRRECSGAQRRGGSGTRRASGRASSAAGVGGTGSSASSPCSNLSRPTSEPAAGLRGATGTRRPPRAESLRRATLRYRSTWRTFSAAQRHRRERTVPCSSGRRRRRRPRLSPSRTRSGGPAP